MPDKESETKAKEVVKEEPMVDLDTSGPGAEIDLPEEKTKEEKPEIEVKNEKTTEDSTKSDDAVEKSNEQLDVRDSKDSEEPVQEKKEEVKKEKELDEYSEGVKRRIAKLTKKMREAERQKDAAITYAKKVQEEQTFLKDRLTKLDTGFVSEMENRINSSLEAAQTKLRSAREAGDIEAEVKAQKDIARLGYEEARLAEIKSKQTIKGKEDSGEVIKQPTITQQEQPLPPPDPKAEEWASKNTWFGTDNAMTYTAFDLHKRLVEEEGYDPKSEEYYSEIDKRIRVAFPQKFGNNSTQETTKPVQNVASAKRSNRGTGRKTVKLTSSQVAIAKKLGVPLEEYAKHLNVKE